MTQSVSLAEKIAARWRATAGDLRHYGAASHADALEACADELEELWAGWLDEALTLEEAAAASGYSYSHLQHQVASGDIPNAGEAGSPRIRRRDLPRRAGASNPASGAGALQLVSDSLAARAGGR